MDLLTILSALAIAIYLAIVLLTLWSFRRDKDALIAVLSIAVLAGGVALDSVATIRAATDHIIVASSK